jgi:hypothetical protein
MGEKGDEQAIRWAPDFRGRNWPVMHSFGGGHLKGRVEGGGDELGRWILFGGAAASRGEIFSLVE